MKMWPVLNLKGDIIGLRPMDTYDVKKYFRGLKYFKRELRQPGTYCERCGINLGERYLYKDGLAYKGFYICPSCYKDKTTNARENTPDLEDLELISCEK